MKSIHRLTAVKAEGFSLVELLIALLVVSMGLLGHARLQISTMQETRLAHYAQIANSSVLDLTQRMETAPNSVVNNYFDVIKLNDSSTLTSNNCLSTSCNDEIFAEYELKQWFSQLEDRLPLPQIYISTSPTTGATTGTSTGSLSGYLTTIVLTWDAYHRGTAHTVATSGQCDTGDIDFECIQMTKWLR